MTETKTMKTPATKPTAEQRKALKQAVADRLATLQEAFIKPRKTPPKPRRFDKYIKHVDWHDPANSSGLIAHLARLAVERALHLTPADGCAALILWQTEDSGNTGATALDSETGEFLTHETATPLQLKAARLMPRAERLLLRLVTASAARTLTGEKVAIGARRRKARQPHWKKRRLV